MPMLRWCRCERQKNIYKFSRCFFWKTTELKKIKKISTFFFPKTAETKLKQFMLFMEKPWKRFFSAVHNRNMSWRENNRNCNRFFHLLTASPSFNRLCLKKSRLNLVLSNNGGRKLAGRSELHDVISGFPSAGFSCF